MTPSASDRELEELVSVAMEMLDQGITPDFDKICAEHPDLRSEVEGSVALAQRLPQLQRESAGADRFAGQVLDGRYRLDMRLGAGAMGVVYRGEDLELRRPVAVKILRSMILDADEAGQRFAREAEVLAAIHHSAVVTIHDRGETEDRDPYLVMELVEGEPLSELLDVGKRRGDSTARDNTDWIAAALENPALGDASYVRTVVSWAAELAAGLAAAHGAGVYHRDVKPSNVFIRSDGGPMLLDFGIAAHASQATITREDETLGTPAYMAPEALKPNSPPSATLDVYGLAATLYHMLTLQAPYEGTPSQVLSGLATRDPKPAFRLRAGLPRDLQAILDRGMARKPSERYATAEAFEEDLRAFLDYRPVVARPITSAGRLWRKLRRSPAFLAASAVILVGAVTALGVQWQRAQVERQREAFAQHWKHMAPNFTIVGLRNRICVSDEDYGRMAAFLDRAVELSVDAVPARLIRSSFRLDHGDLIGSATDMAAVAEDTGTVFARELARRYAELPQETRSAKDLDTSGLPEPRTADDVYLAAYHAARMARWTEVAELLDNSAFDEHPPAQGLILAAQAELLHNREAERRVQRIHSMYERAAKLEGLLGDRTATTTYAMGTAMAYLERYDQALLAMRAGIELADNSHILRINAGHNAWRLGRIAEARTHLDAAIALRPKNSRPYISLVRVHVEGDDLDAARAMLDQIPLRNNAAGQAMRLVLECEIEAARALQLLTSGEVEAAEAAADLAVMRFSEADELREQGPSTAYEIAKNIADGQSDRFFEDILGALDEEPLRWRRLNRALKFYPEDLNVDETASVKRYLERLSAELAQQAELDVSEL